MVEAEGKEVEEEVVVVVAQDVGAGRDKGVGEVDL